MYKRFALVLAFMLVTLANVKAFEIPKLEGRVNDYAHVLSKGDIKKLNSTLESIEKDHPDKPQIVFLLPQSLPEEGIEQYANDVARSWGIGQKGKDNGVLVVIAPNDRKMRVEVGYGLEPYIPDSVALEITGSMKADLRAKNYYGAVMTATNGIVQRLPQKSEAVTKLIEKSQNPTHPAMIFILFFITGGIVLYFIYRMIFSEKPNNDFKPYTGTRIISNPKYGSGYNNSSVYIKSSRAENKTTSNSPYSRPAAPKSQPTTKRKSSSDDSFSTGFGAGLGSSSDYGSSSSSWGSSSSSDSGGGFSGGGGGDFGGGGSSDSW
jgi:uncharacterized protein